MKFKIFCIFDSKVKAYNTPFVQRTTAEAIRTFGDACTRDENLKNHGEDYHLFEIGEFNDDNGLVVPLPAPHAIAQAIQFSSNDRDITIAQARSEGLIPKFGKSGHM